ncbi:MAG: hypothetical protein LBD99_04515 [Candidatus Margulisbacteria bacterium]|jgi:lipopolysaccharide export system protein LptC|nr:hypothetical protein [Candidatus Margulisiibacteriota bacterium]
MKKRFLMNRLSRNKIKRRIILLLVALMLGVVWHYVAKMRPWEARIRPVRLARNLPDYEFQTVSVSEVSGAKTFYRVTASTLTLDDAEGRMERVTGSILDGNRPALNFTAVNGLLDVRRQFFTFNNFAGETTSLYGKPWQINSPQAFWDSARQTFTFDRRPRLSNGEINVAANRIVYNLIFNLFIIDSGCEITRGAYTVRGDRAVLKNALDVLTLEKNVVFSGEDFQIHSDLLDWSVRRDELDFKHNVQLQTSTMALSGASVLVSSGRSRVSLSGDVRLQSKNTTRNIIVNTGRALWRRTENIIEFYENTRAWENDSLIQSENLIYDLAGNELITGGSGRTKIIKPND